ncbi:HNH endonuclease [bacterium]|nr:HNH endonuclease [bacterium]
MANAREICFRNWGKKCFGCGAGIGIEVHHIDTNSDNNDPQNLMPLCGTCHNLVTVRTLQIDPSSRKITTNILGLFGMGPTGTYPPNQVQVQLLKFNRQVKTWEVMQEQPFLLFQDGVNGAYFIECHIQAQHLSSLLYEGTVLNPDDLDDPDSEEYKLNREILELHAVFRRMQEDAERGRPFSDIIVEFNQDYVPDQPLKIIAGQHRARAVQDAVQANKEEKRLHGVKVYFSLSKEQRGEISLVSNTNIAIAKQLVDRFGEQYIGPESRQWCQEVGLIEPGKDFADRLAGIERFTVQILRTLIINFHRGKSFEGKVDEALHEEVHIPRSGSLEPDQEYKRILEENQVWRDSAAARMGRMFAELNKK